jgi:magnesium transporter
MAGAKFYHIVEAGKFQELASVAEARNSLKSGGFLWLDFSQPSREDLQALVEPFGLHPLAIEDSLDFNQVPKMDEYPGHTFILFNRYRHADAPPSRCSWQTQPQTWRTPSPRSSCPPT